MRRHGGEWTKGERGDTDSDGFWYTYDDSSYAYFYFGYLHGVYGADYRLPGQDAIRAGSCRFLRWFCEPSPPTASPLFEIEQQDEDGTWEEIDTLQGNILLEDGTYRPGGWWGWNNIHLDGNIRVKLSKRYSGDKTRLAIDSFRLRWTGDLPEDKDATTAILPEPTLDGYKAAVSQSERPPYAAFVNGECTSWVAYRLNQISFGGRQYAKPGRQDDGTPCDNAFDNYYRAPSCFPPQHFINQHPTDYEWQWKELHGWSDAGEWDDRARSLHIPVKETPRRGAIAGWDGEGEWVGHVAYVEKVNTNNGVVESIVISEMNYLPNKAAHGIMQTTVIQFGDDDEWPDWFIHAEDL